MYWSVEDGKAIVRKVTKPYCGTDIELEMIERNLKDYGQSFIEERPFDDLSEEHRRQLAAEMYQKDRSDTIDL